MEGVYGFQEYLADLRGVTNNQTNTELAELLIRQSAGSVEWLAQRGVHFQKPLSGTLHLGRTNAFFLGGGKALVNALYQHAESLGVKVDYEAQDVTLDISNGRFNHASFQQRERRKEVKAESVVAASGGFQANLDWLAESWGDAARQFLVRGTPYNRGDILKQLLDAGMQQVGEPDQCHAVAIDGRAPKYDGGIVTRIDCLPLGIVVNKNGLRFYDEGEDFWPKRYAIWGRLIAMQPDQIAWSIVDSQSDGLYMPPVFAPETADTLAELAGKIGISIDDLRNTVEAFNAAVQPGSFDREQLDDCTTAGLAINKTHWARRIHAPPFKAYQLRPGITFTYMGVAVDKHARVLQGSGTASDNIFAAGEIMAGNILGQGYLAGIGMTIGNVFGRIAGENA